MQHKTPSVVGLFFEVQPKPGQRQAYFDQVEVLKPFLATHDGLFWMQRYQSMDDPGLILSHQYWAGEQALAAWRQNADHRHAQMRECRIPLPIIVFGWGRASGIGMAKKTLVFCRSGQSPNGPMF